MAPCEWVIDILQEWVLKWITPYKVSGNITPNATCTYFNAGTHNNKPYYRRNNDWLLWWAVPQERWVISVALNVFVPGAWVAPFDEIEADYAPIGDAAGIATVTRGTKLLCTSYVDRGDPVNYDFFTVNFTRDGAWHELDLSAIVPAGPSAVLIRFYALPAIILAVIQLRERGDVNTRAIAALRATVVAVWQDGQLIVRLDNTRIIEYQIPAGVWFVVNAVVNGWWL